MPKFDTYTATIRFNDRLIGGIPVVADDGGRADAYRGWLKGQDVTDDPAHTTPLADTLAADPDMPVATIEQATLNGFRRDQDGLYIEARQVKAMLKEAAQRLGYVKRIRGSRQVLQHDLHVRGAGDTQKIHLDRAEPDGIETRPISVVTPQGPRTSIKAFEYVNQAEITVRILVLAGGVGDGLVGEAELREMLDLAQLLGLGADRSQGEGTFELVGFRREDTPE